MSRLQTWLFSTRTSRHSIYGKIYLVLWVFALLGAVWSYVKLHEEQLLGFGGGIAALFGIATLVQQYFVYQDLHDIEDGSASVRTEYAPWIDMRLEIGLRYLIVTALLLGVGKIASAVSPITSAVWLGYVGAEGEGGFPYDIFKPESDPNQRLFVLGSLLVFLFLLFWNICALLVRIRSPSYRTAIAPAVPREARLRERLISVRIFVFAVSAALCFGYWGFISAGNTVFVQEFARIFIGIYSLIVFFLFLVRFEPTREWLTSKWIAWTD